MVCNINYDLKYFNSIQHYWDKGNEFNLTPDSYAYPTLSPEKHYQDGWRNVVIPQYDSKIEYLGDMFYDVQNDVVSFNKVSFTNEELERRSVIELDQDDSAIKLKKSIEDGKIMYQRFFAYLQRLFDNGNITGVQARNSAQLLFIPLLPINYGQFQLAKANLDSLTPPTNPKELAIFNKAKEQVNNYLQ